MRPLVLVARPRAALCIADTKLLC